MINSYHEIVLQNALRLRSFTLLWLCLAPAWTWAQGIANPDAACPAAGVTIATVDSGRSTAEILVRKAGLLKRFGHDHIILVTKIGGYVHWPQNPQNACGYLSFDVTSLVVDDPVYREKYLLTTNPSSRDIEKTRENMLT